MSVNFYGEAHESEAINVSNVNAAMLLNRLGYEVGEEGIYGYADPTDFLGRCLMALGTLEADEGVKASADRGSGGVTWIDAGLRPGYFKDKLGQLADMATQARIDGENVIWG